MTATQAQFEVVETVANPENTLILIGVAKDGPSHAPFALSSSADVIDIIGDCPLAHAYNLAYSTGVTSILLYRINGKHADATLTYIDTEMGTREDVMSFHSVSANDDSNNITISAGDGRLVVSSSGGDIRNYYFADYPSATLLADALNIDAMYGLIEFTAKSLSHSFQMGLFDENHLYTAALQGADTEASVVVDRFTSEVPEEQLEQLESMLNVALFGEDITDQANFEPNSTLGLMDFGVACLVDMFHDDGAEYTKMLAKFCYNKFSTSHTGTIGVIGVKPLIDPTAESIHNLAMNLMQKKAGDLASSIGETEGYGEASPYSHIQIVTGDVLISSVLAEAPKLLSLAYSYAGTQAMLSHQTNMTNKSLRGAARINYSFSKEDIANLAANGYISIVSSVRKGLVPFSAVTASTENKNSLLRYPHVVRTVHEIARRAVYYLDPYIGEASTSVSRSRAQARVFEFMNEYSRIGSIRSYDVKFSYNSNFTEMYVMIYFIPTSHAASVSSSVTIPFSKGGSL
jgi:hypothetical protein